MILTAWAWITIISQASAHSCMHAYTVFHGVSVYSNLHLNNIAFISRVSAHECRPKSWVLFKPSCALSYLDTTVIFFLSWWSLWEIHIPACMGHLVHIKLVSCFPSRPLTFTIASSIRIRNPHCLNIPDS